MDQSSTPPRPTRVLVIDDDDALRRTLQVVLTVSGYDVAVAASGDLAIESLRPGQYDLIISDFRMPGRNGLETIQALKKIDPNLSCVLLTAYVTDDLRNQSKSSGAHDCISKPFELVDLLSRLNRAIGSDELPTESRAFRVVEKDPA